MKMSFAFLFSKVQNVLLALIIAFGLSYQSGVHAQNAGNIYGSDQVLRPGSADFGVVLQVEIKMTESSAQSRATGAGIGAGLGGLLANSLGGSNNYASSAIGALVGGVLGERLANQTARTESQELVVRLSGSDNGKPRLLVLIQPAPYDELSVGDRVLVTNIGGKFRVKQNNTGLSGDSL